MNRSRKWSFVVMRGADKTVKQFHLSKRSVVAAPVAAVVAVSGFITGLQLKAAYELEHLENELLLQSTAYTQTISGLDTVISGKDEAIVSLQEEILQLSRQAQELKEKMKELQELEQKLKVFIEKYGSSIVQPSSMSAVPNAAKPSTGLVTIASATYSARPSNVRQMASLARHTSLDFQALGEMIDSMEQSMEQTLRQAEMKRTTVDAYPSNWPTRSKQLTSGFGYRKDPFTGKAAFHAGIDIRGKTGDPVFSAADGTVSEVGYDRVLGNYIIINHLGGLQSAYMHLSRIEAKINDNVVRGEKIGLMGSSGKSTGPHLHFQILQKNEPVNPLKYVAHNS